MSVCGFGGRCDVVLTYRGAFLLDGRGGSCLFRVFPVRKRTDDRPARPEIVGKVVVSAGRAHRRPSSCTDVSPRNFLRNMENREKAGLCAAFPGGGRKRIPTRSGCGQSVRTKRSGGGTGKVEWGPGADRAVRKRTTDGREPVVGKVAASAGRDGVERVQGTGEEGSEAETFRKRIIFPIFTDAPCRARIRRGALT